jgi:hypothetical protein
MMRRTFTSLMILVTLLVGLSAPLALPAQRAAALSTGDLGVLSVQNSLGSGVKWPQIAAYEDRVAAVGTFGTSNAVARLFVKDVGGTFPGAVWQSGGLGTKNDFATAAVTYDNNGKIFVARTNFAGSRQIVVTRHSANGTLEYTWTINAGAFPTNPALAIGQGSSANRLMLIWRDDEGDDKPAPYIAWLDNASGTGSFSARQRLTNGSEKSSVWVPGIAAGKNGDFAFAWSRYMARPMVVQVAVWRVSNRSVSNVGIIQGHANEGGQQALHTPSITYNAAGTRLQVAYRGDQGAWLTEMNPQSGSSAPTAVPGGTRTLLSTSKQVDGRVNVTTDAGGRIHLTFAAGNDGARNARNLYYGVLDGGSVVGSLGGIYTVPGGMFNPYAAPSRDGSLSQNHVAFEFNSGGTMQLRVVTFEAPPPFGASPTLSAAKVGGSTTTVDVSWSGIGGRPDGIRYGWGSGSSVTWVQDWTSFTRTLQSHSVSDIEVPVGYQSGNNCVTRTFTSSFRKQSAETGTPAWAALSGTDTIITDYGVAATVTLTNTTVGAMASIRDTATTLAIWGDRVTARPRSLIDTSLSVDGKMLTTIAKVSASAECSNLVRAVTGSDISGSGAVTTTLGGTAASFVKTINAPGFSSSVDSTLPVVMRVDDSLGNQRYYTTTFRVDSEAPDVSSIAASPSFVATASLMGDMVQDIELDLSGVDLSDTVAVLVTTHPLSDEDVKASTTRKWYAFNAATVIDGSTLTLRSWSLGNAYENVTSGVVSIPTSPPSQFTVYVSLMDAAGNLSEPLELTIESSLQTVKWNIPFSFR